MPYQKEVGFTEKPAFQDNLGFFITIRKLKDKATQLAIIYSNFNQYIGILHFFHILKQLYYYTYAYNSLTQRPYDHSSINEMIAYIDKQLLMLQRYQFSQNKQDKIILYKKLYSLKEPITELQLSIYYFLAKANLELRMEELKDPREAMKKGYS